MRMGTPFEEDHPDLQALYAESKAAQWTLDVLPWDEFVVPDAADERTSGAVAAGALVALSDAILRVTSRGVNTAPQTAFPLVLSVEGRDYARHLELWRRVLEQFGPTAPLPAEWTVVQRALAIADNGQDAVTVMLCGVQPMLQALYICADEAAAQPFWKAAYRHLRADLDRHIAIVGKAIALQSGGCEEEVKQAFTATRSLFAALALPDVGELQGFAQPFHSAVSVMSAFVLHLS